MPHSSEAAHSAKGSDKPAVSLRFDVRDLGRMSYDAAYAEQEREHARVMRAREASEALAGVILTVEHDPVITVTRRPDAAGHVLAEASVLEAMGVERRETNRGGDVTYHGPGQLVVYPIVDLRRLGIRLHEYMRVLEQGVIDVLGDLGIAGERDEGATGVWVDPGGGLQKAKVCAMGVRVRRWVSMHGLALNIDPDMRHFGLIVPCGLAGRPVTSVAQILEAQHGSERDPLDHGVLRDALAERLSGLLLDAGRSDDQSSKPAG